MFLEECKYVIKERKIHNYITDDLEISFDSDEEILDKIQIKKILMKKILVKKKILMKRSKYYRKLPDYRRNYYLTHKKKLLDLFKDSRTIRFV